MKHNINDSTSLKRQEIIRIAKLNDFNHKYIKSGWYDDFGNGKRLTKSQVDKIGDTEEFDECIFYLDNDIFTYGGCVLNTIIDDKTKQLFIQNINGMGGEKGKLTKLLYNILNVLDSSGTVVILDNENPSYGSHIRAKYSKLKFREDEGEEVASEYRLKGSY